MPLDADGKGRSLHFRSLDHPIRSTDSGQLEPVTEMGDGLMVSAVDGDLGSSSEAAEPGVLNKIYGMRWGKLALNAAVSDLGRLLAGEILNERAAKPDIHRLESIADTEKRLVEIECVLEEQFVGRFAGWVCRIGAMGLLAVSGGIDVRTATGQDDALAGSEGGGDFRLRGGKWNEDGLSAGRFYCCCVEGPVAGGLVRVDRG